MSFLDCCFLLFWIGFLWDFHKAVNKKTGGDTHETETEIPDQAVPGAAGGDAALWKLPDGKRCG